jgi:hypothetical protein
MRIFDLMFLFPLRIALILAVSVIWLPLGFILAAVTGNVRGFRSMITYSAKWAWSPENVPNMWLDHYDI